MDGQIRRPAPKHITEALDASALDIAEGNVHDAEAAHAEARRMLADHERTQQHPPRAGRGKPARRTGSA
jgi:hypothetical protein